MSDGTQSRQCWWLMLVVSLLHVSAGQAAWGGSGHSRSVMSSLPETMRCPSGLNATPDTQSVWPVSGAPICSSWERIDLHDVIYGNVAEVVPKWLTRRDGMSLLYPGCTHSFHGPSGHGKSSLAHLGIAQVLLDTDEHVLYLDYESFPSQIVRRLKQLGVPNDVLDNRFHYRRPTRAPDVRDIDRNAFADMLSRPYAIVWLDGAARSGKTAARSDRSPHQTQSTTDQALRCEPRRPRQLQESSQTPNDAAVTASTSADTPHHEDHDLRLQ